MKKKNFKCSAGVGNGCFHECMGLIKQEKRLTARNRRVDKAFSWHNFMAYQYVLLSCGRKGVL